MPQNAARFTREDIAKHLEGSFFRVLLETTDARSFKLAKTGRDVASAAASHYANAKGFDRATGGGSSEAWSYRNKGARTLKKAQDIAIALREHGEHMAGFSQPSLATVIFLAKAVEWDAGVPDSWEDHRVAELACQKQLIHTVEGGIRRHRITDLGRSVLAAMRDEVAALDGSPKAEREPASDNRSDPAP